MENFDNLVPNYLFAEIAKRVMNIVVLTLTKRLLS